MVRSVEAWQARCGLVWKGPVGFGVAGQVGRARRGGFWRGLAWQASYGLSRQGRFRFVVARQVSQVGAGSGVDWHGRRGL